MRKRAYLIFLTGIIFARLSSVTNAQTYTNNSGTFYYSVTNSSITITGFSGVQGTNPPVVIPSSIGGFPVIAIGSNAFFGDYNVVQNVVIPNSVTSIGQDAFDACTYLTNVLVGYGVTNIGDDAFHDTGSRGTFYYLGNAPSFGTNVFPFDFQQTNFYLPAMSGWTNQIPGISTVPWYPPIPPLSITTYSNQPVVVFAMPAPFPVSIGTNYVLQMTTNLASTNWVAVTNSISLISIQVTNASSAAFFRLQPL